MSISYNSLTGIEGSPVSYISDLALKGRDKLDSSSATTRIIILLAFVVVTILYYVLFSSLGKGIAAASLAAILESRNLSVTIIKLDP